MKLHWFLLTATHFLFSVFRTVGCFGLLEIKRKTLPGMSADFIGRHKGMKCSWLHTSWRKSNLYWNKIWNVIKSMDLYSLLGIHTYNIISYFTTGTLMVCYVKLHWFSISKSFCFFVISQSHQFLWGFLHSINPDFQSSHTQASFKALCFCLICYDEAMDYQALLPHKAYS